MVYIGSVVSAWVDEIIGYRSIFVKLTKTIKNAFFGIIWLIIIIIITLNEKLNVNKNEKCCLGN